MIDVFEKAKQGLVALYVNFTTAIHELSIAEQHATTNIDDGDSNFTGKRKFDEVVTAIKYQYLISDQSVGKHEQNP